MKRGLVVGILVLAIAGVMIFFAVPYMRAQAEDSVYVLSVSSIIDSGTLIEEKHISERLTMKGAVPTAAIMAIDKERVLGMYAKDTIYPEDFLFDSKFTDDPFPLSNGQQYIALPVPGLANVMSGQLKPGDIVSIYVWEKAQMAVGLPANPTSEELAANTTLYPQLKYVEVVMQTNARTEDIEPIKSGQTNSNTERNIVPSTLIVKVWDEQARMLVEFVNSATLHVSYRGNSKLNPELLKQQADDLQQKG